MKNSEANTRVIKEEITFNQFNDLQFAYIVSISIYMPYCFSFVENRLAKYSVWI